MSQFRPTRASPRLKPTKIPDPSQHKLSPDVSRSSIASAHELLALSQDEIELIDAVIERAGPSATTFLTVFKAYNDILTERGLDPHEVEYYGKLLKLGTTKGRNWGEKWDAIKSQHQKQGSRGDSNGRNHSHRQIQAPKTGLKSASKRVIRRPSPPSESDGTFTLNSHDNESVVPSIDERDVPAHPASRHKTPAYQNHAIRRPWIAPSSVSEDLITISSVPTLDARTVPNHRQRTFLSSESVASVESDDVPSTTPPSYRATTRNVRPTEKLLTSQSRATLAADEARKVVAMARQRRGSIVNGEDAWKKIQMERDEADADQFRADRLQERCWEVWKQGYHWIVTTNRQIGEARDNLILRVKLQRWRAITTSREELYQRVTNISNTRCLRAALETWKSRVREREQVKWREMMRLKMKTVKDKRDLKLLKDVWLKWRQSYLLELAGHQHTKQSQLRFYHRWKKRLSGIIEQEHTADNFFDNSARNVLGRCWKRWRDANDMRYRERIMVERVELRLMTKSLLVWRKEMQERVTAKKFYRILLLKSAIRSWKTARDRIRKMERRADKHLSRQDDVLLRAVARVWKARGRGKLLERVKAARLVKSSWSVWRQRMRQRKEDEDLAMAFSFRNKTNLLATSLQSWRNAHITHRNAQSFAVQYHASQLQDKMILSWRIELREKIKLQKLARRAEKHFVIRRAWKNWAGAIRIKAMENRVKGVEERVVAKHFYAWLHRAREKKRRREVETTIRENTKKRTLKHAMSVWTNRVIEIKLRELDVAQHSDRTKLSLAFKKWQSLRARHIEELSLMESYQYVKREETMRRLVHRWLSLAISTRRRRLALQQKEEDLRFAKITAAWDKWRERFIDEKLRPTENNVIIQSRRNLLFRAFGVWHSKTKSLPAIRCYTTNLKFKYFAMWRKAMPKALQAKRAREMDRKAVYSKFTSIWLESLQTKRALKAVARARYLRLPTAAPRQTRPALTSSSPASRPVWPAFPKRTDDEDNAQKPTDDAVDITRPARTRVGAEPRAALVGPSTAIRDTSPTRSSRGRSSFLSRLPPRDEVSPTRSAAGSVLSTGSRESGRSKIWLELRAVQRKSGPPSAKGPL